MNNSTRDSIFENEKTIEQNIKESLTEIWDNPKRFVKIYWFFFLQVCLSLFLLVWSILLPIWLMYGQN